MLALGVLVAAMSPPAVAQGTSVEELERRLQKAKEERARRDAAAARDREAAEAERKRKEAEAARAAADRKAQEARLATVVVQTDAPCTLSMNGEALGVIPAGISKHRVSPGQKLVSCASSEEKTSFEGDLEARSGQDTVLRIALAAKVAEAQARRKAEEQARREAEAREAQVRLQREADARAAQMHGQVLKDCDVCPELVVVGDLRPFDMGSPASEPGRDDDETQRRVRIARAYAIGKTEVTQAQWRAVMGSNPSHFQGCDDCPVENVSWDEVQTFVQRLNQRSGQRYRLPSEAEWEYSARAGSAGRYSFGDSEALLGEHAWFGGNSGGKTQPVGRKRANAWGLHDMHGNVWEWVQDCYGPHSEAPTDGSAKETSNCGQRVLRGGSWDLNPLRLRSASRISGTPGGRSGYAGFRLARTAF